MLQKTENFKQWLELFKISYDLDKEQKTNVGTKALSLAKNFEDIFAFWHAAKDRKYQDFQSQAFLKLVAAAENIGQLKRLYDFNCHDVLDLQKITNRMTEFAKIFEDWHYIWGIGGLDTSLRIAEEKMIESAETFSHFLTLYKISGALKKDQAFQNMLAKGNFKDLSEVYHKHKHVHCGFNNKEVLQILDKLYNIARTFEQWKWISYNCYNDNERANAVEQMNDLAETFEQCVEVWKSAPFGSKIKDTMINKMKKLV